MPNELQFWEALRTAIAADDLEAATMLVAEQMQLWSAQLEREMCKLTHNGSTTIH